MERLLTCIFTVLCLVSGSIGKKGFGPGEQEWGYVEVRPGAHMFWWLYYTTANESRYDQPLIVWLSGGPGDSSTAKGNFEQLGPLDTDLKPRRHTWVKNYNILFVDSPVGTGFSYVKDNKTDLVKTNAQVASDLLIFIKKFYNQLPKFRPVPTFIATESYGGKMSSEFALYWYRAQKKGTIQSNLKGIGMGDPWISSVDSVMAWAPYLLNTGMIDMQDFEKIDAEARKTKDIVEKGNKGEEAMNSMVLTLLLILNITSNIDYYNILTRWQYNATPYLSPKTLFFFDKVEAPSPALLSLINGPVKKALGLDASNDVESQKVYNALWNDFMTPGTNLVEQLLNETNLYVFIWSGQLDMIANGLGTLRWVEKLKWKDADKWKYSSRFPLVPENSMFLEGYYKHYKKLWMYWVDRAGHTLPKDNPLAMEMILLDLTNASNKRKTNKRDQNSTLTNKCGRS